MSLEGVKIDLEGVEGQVLVFNSVETKVIRLGVTNVVAEHQQVSKNVQNLPSISNTYQCSALTTKGQWRSEELSVLQFSRYRVRQPDQQVAKTPGTFWGIYSTMLQLIYIKQVPNRATHTQQMCLECRILYYNQNSYQSAITLHNLDTEFISQ